MKIVSVGEITSDHYLKQKSYYVGGRSLNFAVHAKRSGAETVSLVSCVGSRAVDVWILKLLEFEGVDHSRVAVLEGKTAECAIDVEVNGDRVFPAGGYHENVLSELSLTEDIKGFLNLHDIVVTIYDGPQIDSICNQLVQLPKNGILRVVDFGNCSNGRIKEVSPGLFKQLDLAFFSGDLAALEYLLPLAKACACQFVITMGAQGSVALTADGVIRQSALPAEVVVDSTGCGDSFQGAFTVSYFRDGDIAKALEAGAKQAAEVLQYFGAFDQLQANITL